MTEANLATGTVRSLESSSTEIQQVVTLIPRVADRTRLLALNASIEAVRGDASVNALGLSQMAEMLRAEVVQFLAVMRSD